MALADFFGGGASAPKALDPLQLGRQTTRLQEQFLPDLQRLRGQHDAGLISGATDQLGRAQDALGGISSDIAGDISRDRASLTGGDLDLLRQQSAGFAGSERLQALLQSQAEQGLRLGGSLSAEQQRATDQLTQSATQRQGRGAGAFNVGQLALGRAGAMDAREAQRRQFGLQTIQSGLAVSSPAQNFMRQNAQSSGGILDRLRNQQDFAQQNTVNFDPISSNVSQIAQQNFQAEQQKFMADRQFLPDLISGGLSAAGSAAGGGL